MRFVLLFASLVFFLFSCSTTYYIVRHAEKDSPAMNAAVMMSTDPPLSSDGQQRALALMELLKNKKIGYIFSTNTIRTKATAQPTADYFGLPIEMYNPRPDSVFINKLRLLSKNTLIVGHSNTVDDIVNLLCGELKIPADLEDHEYDNLFIVKKKGKRFVFTRQRYGAPAH
jgi:phosphohistidine phosphatase SixA